MDKRKLSKICRIISLSSISCLLILLLLDLITDLEIPNIYAELGYIFCILETLRYSLLRPKQKWQVVIFLIALSFLVIVFIIVMIDMSLSSLRLM